MNDYDINITAKAEFEAFFTQISNADFTNETQKASLLAERIALSSKYGTDNTLLLKADMLIARKSKQTQKQ